MESFKGDGSERRRSVCLRILAMTACAAAFAAGILLPTSPDEQAGQATASNTRIAKIQYEIGE